MRATRRSLFVDGLITAGSVCVIGAGMLLLDHRVQDEISRFVHSGRPSGRMMSAGQQVQGFMIELAQLARDQSIAHAPLAVFAVIALILFIVMTRVL